MFFCDTCAEKNKWPQSWSKSGGRCEVCGKTAVCNDIPSKELPSAYEDDPFKNQIGMEQGKRKSLQN